MSQATDFVKMLYAAFGRGDVGTILDNLDPEIRWISNGDPKTIPWTGARGGKDGALAFFQALGANLEFEVFEPNQFIDGGNTVAVLGRTRAHCKSGGQGTFDCEWVHVFTIGSGKLLRFQEFYDTAAIEHALAA